MTLNVKKLSVESENIIATQLRTKNITFFATQLRTRNILTNKWGRADVTSGQQWFVGSVLER